MKNKINKSPTKPELDPLHFYYVSKARQLDINKSMREHFTIPVETKPTNTNK